MADSIDTHLFIDIIVSEGCILLDHEQVEEDSFEHYTGPSGKRVTLCITDEYLRELTARMYLSDLGLGRLGDNLFPKS